MIFVPGSASGTVPSPVLRSKPAVPLQGVGVAQGQWAMYQASALLSTVLSHLLSV